MEKRKTSINKSKDELSIIQNLELYLCPDVRNVIKKLPGNFKLILEEIRLRADKPLMVFGGGKDYFVDINGNLVLAPVNSYYIGKGSIEKTLQFVSNYSIYSIEDELKNGYITIHGGHRIGIVGKVLMDGKGIRTLKNFSEIGRASCRERV